MPIFSTTKTIKRASLAFQCVNHVQRSDSLAFGVLGVGDSVTDDGFEEGFEDTAGFFIDHCGCVLAGYYEQLQGVWRQEAWKIGVGRRTGDVVTYLQRYA